MKLHGNARTCLPSRLLIVHRVLGEGWMLAQAAEAAGVSVRTVSKWLRRYRDEGEQALFDRSSAPRSVPSRTEEQRIGAIAALRRLRMTAAEIAEALSMPLSTVSGILTRIGLGKLSRLQPAEPANRYERKQPGELIHVDVKKSAGSVALATESPAASPVALTIGGPTTSAGSSCRSRSTTRPASRTSRCSTTRGRRPRLASSAAPSLTTVVTGSRLSA